MSMHTFYTQTFATPQTQFAGLARIAAASLKQVLAVRSELAWDTWHEAK